MIKKWTTVLLAGLLMLLMLTACTETEEPAIREETVKKPVLTSEPVTLTVAGYDAGAERTEILRLIADKYEADHSNVKVDLQLFPADRQEELLRLLENGTADIVEINADTLYAYAEQGHLADITDRLAYWDEAFTLTSAAQNVMKAYDFTPYFVPHTIYQDAVYYRKDWLEKTKIKDPKQPDTWEKVLSAGRWLQEAGTAEYGLSYASAGRLYQFADSMIWSGMGDKVMNLANDYAGYYTDANDGTTVFSLPEAEKGLRLFKELINEISFSSDMGEDSPTIADGNVAMTIAGTDVISQCAMRLDDAAWDVLPLPLGESGQFYFANGYAGWALSAGSKEADTAADFLFFLSDSDNNTYFAKTMGTIPVHTDAAEKDDYFIDGRIAGFMKTAKKPANYRFVTAPKMYDAFEEYEETIDEIYMSYLEGGKTEAEVLSYLDSYWKRAFEEEGMKWPTKKKASAVSE